MPPVHSAVLTDYSQSDADIAPACFNVILALTSVWNLIFPKHCTLVAIGAVADLRIG